MKTKNTGKFLTLTTLIFLYGCAPVVYQEPTQGPTATVSFVDTAEINQTQATIFENASDCSGQQDITPYTLSNQKIKVPANKEIAFNINWSNPMFGCNILFSFSPEINQKYMVYFKNEDNQCFIKIGKMLDGNIIPVAFHKRKPNFYQLTDNDPFCLPLSN